MEKAYARMRSIFPQARFDLCTCFPGLPADGSFDTVFRVTDAGDALSKGRMVLAMRHARPSIAALVFSGEAILLPWKLLLMLLLPSKLLVVNENGDFFWLDWSNRAVLREFLRVRFGVDGLELLRACYRALILPLSVLFLAVLALFSYLGRWTRLLYWSLTGRHRPV